jgi:geranylgeranyl diphosphate/geranylgeranyl-bacteriochlorophyllide a reductase
MFSIVAFTSFVSTAWAFTPNSSFLGKTTVVRNAISSGSNLEMKYKVAVVGGGPSGACAAEIFAQEKGIDTVMFERKLDNAKPCGGAIPLCMVGEFDIPESVVDRKVRESTVLFVADNLVDICANKNSSLFFRNFNRFAE